MFFCAVGAILNVRHGEDVLHLRRKMDIAFFSTNMLPRWGNSHRCGYTVALGRGRATLKNTPLPLSRGEPTTLSHSVSLVLLSQNRTDETLIKSEIVNLKLSHFAITVMLCVVCALK